MAQGAPLRLVSCEQQDFFVPCIKNIAVIPAIIETGIPVNPLEKYPRLSNNLRSPKIIETTLYL